MNEDAIHSHLGNGQGFHSAFSPDICMFHAKHKDKMQRRPKFSKPIKGRLVEVAGLSLF